MLSETYHRATLTLEDDETLVSPNDADPLPLYTEESNCSTASDAPGIPLPKFDITLDLWEEAPESKLFATLSASHSPDTADRICPGCGISFGEISATGTVGCGLCYESFRAHLAPLLRTLHGDTGHIGLTSRAHRERSERMARAAKLREQLKAAVQREAYEEAVRLRDELKALERQL